MSYSSNRGSRIERADRSDLWLVFKKYAVRHTDGAYYIKRDDFICKFLGLLDRDRCNEKTLGFLGGIIDTSKDELISFPEFVKFEGVLCAPDALYNAAFRLFDTNGNGKVCYKEFVEIISHTTLQNEIPFDLKGPFAKRYFGKNRRRSITYVEFCQFLHDFNEEYATQAFRKLEHEGYVSISDFEFIMKTLRRYNLTPQMSANLKEMLQNYLKEDNVSFPVFNAFNVLLNNIDLMKKVYMYATEGVEDKELSKSDFLYASQYMTNVTPLEVDLLFHISRHLNESETIILSDFEAIAPEQYYRKVNKRVLDIKAVSTKSDRNSFIEILENVYRFTIGSVAGALEAIGSYPFDLVKTRLQMQRPSSLLPKKVYINTYDCIRKVAKVESPMALFKGWVPQSFGTSLAKAVKLSLNDWIRERLMNRRQQILLSHEIFAGACAGAVNVCIINPFEAIKIRIQAAGQMFPRVPLSTLEVIRQLGFRGLFRGFEACLLRDVPFSAIFFPTYAHMKVLLQDEDGYNTMTSLLVAGVVASLPGTPLSMPFDVIKTRMQADPRPGEQRYYGVWDAAEKIWKKEGIRAFWQGTRVVKPTQFGMSLLVYEALQRFFYIDFGGIRPTGSQAKVVVKSVDQIRSDNPDHIGGYSLACPIIYGIQSRFGLIFPAYNQDLIKTERNGLPNSEPGGDNPNVVSHHLFSNRASAASDLNKEDSPTA